MTLNNLFSSIRLGKVEVKNRIAMAPMGVGIHNPDSTLPRELIPYVEARAKGGTGLIISEFTNVSKYQKLTLLGVYNDKFILGLSKYASAIHRFDAKAFLQIATLGGKYEAGSYAPSAIESPLYLCKPKEFTSEQIQEVIEEFSEAARRAQNAGFDGVELHGAHSYLIGQFMSPHFNRRDDEYGGDFDRRMRAPVEVVRGIKRICGKDFPVGLKFSAWEDVPRGVNHSIALEIAKCMAKEGVAYLHTQTTAFYPPLAVRSPYPTMPPMYTPRNTLLELAENLKKNIQDVPVLAAGGIVDPFEAENIIRTGKADMVVLGRALFADPDLPRKAMEGKRIRPCIRCNVCHHEVVSLQKEAACTVNPHLLHERESQIENVKYPKKVIVVGSGPGGIVAALTASQRGHDVTLFEKQHEIGGLIIPGSAPPFKRDVGALLDYYRGEIEDSDVTLELNTDVNVDMIQKIQPDVLIIAVGGLPIRPDIPSINGENVITAAEALQNPGLVEDNVVIIGGGEVGCETALYLKDKGKKPVIVEALDRPLSLDEIPNNSVVLEEMLEEAGIRVYTSSKVVEITSDAVWIIRHENKLQKISAETVILAVGLRSNDSLVNKLKESCSQSYALGDCVNPARIFEAVHEADSIARSI